MRAGQETRMIAVVAQNTDGYATTECMPCVRCWRWAQSYQWQIVFLPAGPIRGTEWLYVKDDLREDHYWYLTCTPACSINAVMRAGEAVRVAAAEIRSLEREMARMQFENDALRMELGDEPLPWQG